MITSYGWNMIMGEIAILVLCIFSGTIRGFETSVPRMPSLAQLVNVEDQPPFKTVGDINNFIEDIERKASILIAKSFSEHIRRRRSASNLKSLKITGANLLSLNMDSKLTSIFGKSYAHEIITYGNKTYLVICTVRNELQAVVDISNPDQKLEVLSEFYVLPATIDKIDKIAGSLYGNWLWLALGSSSSNLVNIIRVDLNTGAFIFVHNILVQGGLGCLHMFQATSRLYLVIGTSQPGHLSISKGSSGLYVLLKDYFDYMDDLPLKAKNVVDVTGFADAGNYYIIFAGKSVGGSQVYRFSPVMQSLQLLQELPDKETLKVVYFLDQHDNKHYIVTLDNGGLPKIYWWDREQFTEWQSLSADPMDPECSVGVLTLDNLEIIIFISHKEKIIFYLDDQTAHYHPIFTLQTNCSVISDLHGVTVNGASLVSYICLDGSGSSVGYKANVLILESITATIDKYPLVSCMEDLNNQMEARKHDVQVAEELIPFIMTAEGPQDWIGDIVFGQGINVTGTTTFINSVTLQDHEGARDQFLDLATEIDSIKDIVKDTPRVLENVLYYNLDQDITGNINGSSVIIDKAELGTLQIKAVNGVPLSDLPKEFLMDGYIQNIDYSMHVNELTVQTVTTRTSPITKLNNILTKDLMRKSVANQVVTGNHIFSTVVVKNIINSEDLFTPVIINGISTEEILTKGSDVSIVEPMSLETLAVDGLLDAGLINNINITRLAEEAVFTDLKEKQVLRGNYTLIVLHVLGNVDVKSINNIIIGDLNKNVLKKTGYFKLSGPVSYVDNLTVSGNLTVKVVNDVLWNDMMDLNSSGIIYGKHHFKVLEVSESLECNDINGIDLSNDAMLRYKNQVIQGHVAFTDDVIVRGEEGVLMSNGATINGTDLSALYEEVLNQTGLVYVQEDIKFSDPLSILGNITASSINGMSLENIGNRFWRRSVHQDINVSLHINEAVFQDAVIGKSLNNYQISDYLNIHGPQVISGEFSFKSPVTVTGNLNISDGHKVDGVDVSKMAENAVTLEDQQTIAGLMKFSGKVTIEGDLEVDEYLNTINVSALMMLDRPQTITDSLTFSGHTNIDRIVVLGSNISVLSLNGKDLNAVDQNIVLKDEDATINSPLLFTNDLHVDDLYVKGKIDEVDLDGVLSNAIKKSSEEIQFVTAPVTLSANLQLEAEASLGEVNKKNWTSHLSNVVLRNYSGQITGVKTFTQPLVINSNFNPRTINNISVVNLKDMTLTKSDDQFIFGYYTFNNNIDTSTLSCSVIGGVNTSELMLIDEIQEFPSTVTFLEDVTFVGDLSTFTDVLNGCNITELQEMTPSMNQNKNFEFYSPVNIHHLHVTGNLTCTGEILLGTKDIFKLKPFLNNLVQRSSHQEITGKVIFIKDVEIDALHLETNNNIEITKLLQESVRDDENTTVRCNLDFQKFLRIKKLTIYGALLGIEKSGLLINGVNVSESYAQAAQPTDGKIHISGNIFFTNGFKTDNLYITGHVNSTKVSDLLTFTPNGEVAGNITFSHPISIAGNLQVYGLIDGVNLTEVFGNRIKLDDDQTLSGDFVFDNIIVEGDLEVANINAVQIADLVVKYGRAVQEITGQKNFEQLYINGSIDAPLVNGINVEALSHSIVRKDQNITFDKPVTFEKEVRAFLLLGARELEKDMDLKNMMENMSSAKNKFTEQCEHIQDMYSLAHKLNSNNYINAHSMFSELAYIEKQKFQSLENFGDLWFGKNPSLRAKGSFLSIKSDNKDRFCEAVTSMYQVYDDGEINNIPKEEISGSRFVLSNPSTDLHATLDVRCNDDDSQVKSVICVSQQKGNVNTVLTQENRSLGFVVDAAMFVDQGITYIVTVTMLQYVRDPTERATITAMMFNTSSNQLAPVWTETTQNSASNLDLTLVKGVWHLLIANHHQAKDISDPYTAVSQLFVWQSSQQKFKLKGEFLADHVTSGAFLKSVWPIEEVFFSLTQLKSADYAVFEENVHYTKEVMIYRYSDRRGVFEVFQLLPTYGVVDQSSFTIDDSLYLLLLSEVKESLSVYRYIPLEGFRLYQEVTLESGQSLEVVDLPLGGKMIVVSMRSLAGLMTLSVKTKGLDLDKLILP